MQERPSQGCKMIKVFCNKILGEIGAFSLTMNGECAKNKVKSWIPKHTNAKISKSIFVEPFQSILEAAAARRNFFKISWDKRQKTKLYDYYVYFHCVVISKVSLGKVWEQANDPEVCVPSSH